MSAAIPTQRRRGPASDTWPCVRLGDVATYVNGYAFKPTDWSSAGRPIIRIQDLTGNSYQMNRYSGNVPEKYEVIKGDVLISWSASLGVYIWDREDAFLNQHIFKVVFDKEDIDKRYFFHQVSLILRKSAFEAHGCTMKHLTKPVFDALQFVLPPLAIQRRIAAKLDLLCDIVAKRKNQLSQLNQLVKSRFVEMFGNVKSSVAIGERFKTQSGGTPKSSENKFYENGTIPWLTSGEVGQGVVRKVDRCITQAGLDNSSAKWTPIDSVLVAMYGATAGKVGLLKIKATTNQAVCSILPAQGMMPEFVYYAVASKTDWMLQQAAGGAQPNISQGVVRKMRIPNPPLALQREFAAFVEKVDKLAFAARRRRDVARQLYRAKIQEFFG